jgi:hypothetical protein
MKQRHASVSAGLVALALVAGTAWMWQSVFHAPGHVLGHRHPDARALQQMVAAAERGDAGAQYALASIVTYQDVSHAVHRLAQAAAQGYAVALHEVQTLGH